MASAFLIFEQDFVVALIALIVYFLALPFIDRKKILNKIYAQDPLDRRNKMLLKLQSNADRLRDLKLFFCSYHIYVYQESNLKGLLQAILFAFNILASKYHGHPYLTYEGFILLL